MTDQYRPSLAPDNWCFGCDCPEILPAEGAIYCGECFHGWVNEAHLEHSDAECDRELYGVARHRPWQEIFACPICSHDL